MKSIIITLIICFIVFSVFFSCRSNNSNNDSKSNLKKVIGKKLELPIDMVPVKLSDSIKCEDYFRSKYKVVYYVDSTECNECCVHYMSLFKNFFKKSNRSSSPLLIIFNTSDYFDIKIFMDKYDVKFPYFLDTNNSFKLSNKFLKNKSLNIFLLRNDTIIFAGSRYSENFCKIFLEQIGR